MKLKKSLSEKLVSICVHLRLIFLRLSVRSPNGIGTKADVFCAFPSTSHGARATRHGAIKCAGRVKNF